MLDLFEDKIEKVEELRKIYKHENEDVKHEIINRLSVLKSDLDKEFIKKVGGKYKMNVEIEKFGKLKNGPLFITDDNFKEVASSITLKKLEEDELSDQERDWLDENGFYANPAWGTTARLDLENGDAVSVNAVEVVKEAIDRGFVITKIERYPLKHDLASIEGDPFHWGAEFPEVVGDDNSNGFDIVIGNPPYGRNVLSDSDKILLRNYRTSGINDIVAPFVERQIQLLKDGGYFGNVVTLKIAYQDGAAELRNLIGEKLANSKLACFARRPEQVFKGTQVRTGFLMGTKQSNGDVNYLSTSEFIRFFDDEKRRQREGAFSGISFCSTEGLWLGEKIGGGNKSMPKIGNNTIKAILLKLKSESQTTVGEVMKRKNTNNKRVVWRREGISYFMNPLMENLYPEGEKPREVKPMYFESQIVRQSVFLILQTSLYYLFWMVYGNEHHLPWKLIYSFPFPDKDQLNSRSGRIDKLSDALWGHMSDRFKGGSREVIKDAPVLKPLMDKADDLFGEIYGLSDDQIEFVKRYQEEYRLSKLDKKSLDLLDISGLSLK